MRIRRWKARFWRGLRVLCAGNLPVGSDVQIIAVHWGTDDGVCCCPGTFVPSPVQAKGINRGSVFSCGMNHRDLILLRNCVLLILLGVSLVGCGGYASRGELGVAQSATQEYWWAGNSCGYLRIHEPLSNVSGWLTGPTKANVTVDVYVAPNDSLDAALDVVVRCRPIGNAQADETGRFSFTNLPAGLYFVALPSREFTQMQGFPVIDEYEPPGNVVRMLWYGGSFSYSIAAFSVSQKEDADRSRPVSP